MTPPIGRLPDSEPRPPASILPASLLAALLTTLSLLSSCANPRNASPTPSSTPSPAPLHLRDPETVLRAPVFESFGDPALGWTLPPGYQLVAPDRAGLLAMARGDDGTCLRLYPWSGESAPTEAAAREPLGWSGTGQGGLPVATRVNEDGALELSWFVTGPPSPMELRAELPRHDFEDALRAVERMLAQPRHRGVSAR
jgi:hypothetical protein